MRHDASLDARSTSPAAGPASGRRARRRCATQATKSAGTSRSSMSRVRAVGLRDGGDERRRSSRSRAFGPRRSRARHAIDRPLHCIERSVRTSPPVIAIAAPGSRFAIAAASPASSSRRISPASGVGDREPPAARGERLAVGADRPDDQRAAGFEKRHRFRVEHSRRTPPGAQVREFLAFGYGSFRSGGAAGSCTIVSTTPASSNGPPEPGRQHHDRDRPHHFSHRSPP